MYNIDYNRLIFLLLPLNKRGETILLFLQSAIKPFVDIYNQFIMMRQTTVLKATYNSQVLSLQTYLRNYLGSEQIWLDDAPEHLSLYVFQRLENQDLPYCYNTGETPAEEDEEDSVYNTQEDNDATIDGIIRCASFLYDEYDVVIKAIVKEYIFADKQFRIEYI